MENHTFVNAEFSSTASLNNKAANTQNRLTISLGSADGRFPQIVFWKAGRVRDETAFLWQGEQRFAGLALVVLPPAASAESADESDGVKAAAECQRPLATQRPLAESEPATGILAALPRNQRLGHEPIAVWPGILALFSTKPDAGIRNRRICGGIPAQEIALLLGLNGLEIKASGRGAPL